MLKFFRSAMPGKHVGCLPVLGSKKNVNRMEKSLVVCMDLWHNEEK